MSRILPQQEDRNLVYLIYGMIFELSNRERAPGLLSLGIRLGAKRFGEPLAQLPAHYYRLFDLNLFLSSPSTLISTTSKCSSKA